jgi:deoxycytidylate deaminase
MTIKPKDIDYMAMACSVAKNSNDPKCKVGAFLVCTETKVVKDTEYECESECHYWQHYHQEPVYAPVTEQFDVSYQGFNNLNFGRGLPDKLCQIILDNPEMKALITTHAEQYLLGVKNNQRVFEKEYNATLYVTKFPCFDCAEIIVTANIKRVVTARIYKGSKWAFSQNQALALFKEKGVQVEYIDIQMKDSFPNMIDLTMNLKREDV